MAITNRITKAILTPATKDDVLSAVKAIRDQMKKDIADQVQVSRDFLSKSLLSHLGELVDTVSTKRFEIEFTKRLETEVEAKVKGIEQEYERKYLEMRTQFEERSKFLETAYTQGLEQFKLFLQQMPTPMVNVSVPELLPPVVNVNVPESVINVAGPVVNVPEQRQPIVNVSLPDMLPPEVTVNVPEQKIPDVIVRVPAARLVKKVVEYDAYNRPHTIVEEEVNGPSQD